jgi:predicted secreted hydrolase
MHRCFFLVPLFLFLACHRAEEFPVPGAEVLSPIAAMKAGDPTGFALALEPRLFEFPQDHGPHPEFRTEWWYFVGHLESENGHHFGYQLTFFRQALRPEIHRRTSKWATRDLWMAHFALTDISAATFYSSERFARGAVGLAGVEDGPFRVWVENWQAQSEGGSLFPLHLTARTAQVAIELRLEAEKPLVLQGDHGLSRKGQKPGSASYYYSFSRLRALGRVELAGASAEVSGSGWMDREWSTASLEAGQVGWDWFALQLDDGRDLMMYQIRLENGGVEPLSHGSLVAPDGSHVFLHIDDVELKILDRWRSPRGTSYPAGWRLRLPEYDLDLTVEPLLANQELDVTLRYWEGAVRVLGTSAGVQVTGRGYVELVGYDP